MHRKLFITAMLLFFTITANSQSLTIGQLLKLWGFVAQSVDQPRSKIIYSIIKPINVSLLAIDHKWSTMEEKDVLYGDNEMWFTWSYPDRPFEVCNFEATIKSIN